MKKGFIFSLVAVLMSAVMSFTGCATNYMETFKDSDSEEKTVDSVLENGANVDDTSNKNIITTETVTPTKAYRSLLDSEGYGTSVDNNVVAYYETEKEADVYNFAVSRIAYQLDMEGYSVSKGIAFDEEENPYVGLIFKTDDMENVGFLQVTDDSTTTILTSEVVENGVVAVVNEVDEGSLVDTFALVNSDSGVYRSMYYKTESIGEYAVKIDVESYKTAELDYSIDAFNYDNNTTMWNADLSKKESISATSLYSDVVQARKAATDLVKQVISLQNENAMKAQKTSIIIYQEDLLDRYIATNSEATLNDFSVKALQKAEAELQENQFLLVTTEGIQVLTVPTEEEIAAAAQQRMHSGIINTITNTLLIVGSVSVAVFTWGAGTPVAITTIAMVTAGVATIYSVSNLVEGVQDIYYGAKGDIYTQSFNPMKEAVQKLVGDKEKGEKIYHTIGITSVLLSSIMVPALSAIKIGAVQGLSVGRTLLLVSRAVAVEVVKIGVSAAVGYYSGLQVSRLIEQATDNKILAQYGGFTATILTGILAYKGLNKIDKVYNFSGLNSKLPAKYGKYYKELSQDEAESLMKEFKQETWNQKSITQREQDILRMTEYIERQVGLEYDVNVKFYNKAPDANGVIDYGGYIHSTNTLEINIHPSAISDSMEVVNTIAHELRHAFQYQTAAYGSDMYKSLRDYITPKESLKHCGNYSEYKNQLCEKDAFSYGDMWSDYVYSEISKPSGSNSNFIN